MYDNKNIVIPAKIIFVLNWLVLLLAIGGNGFSSRGITAFNETPLFFWVWLIPVIFGLMGVSFIAFINSDNKRMGIIKNLKIISIINILLGLFLLVFSRYIVGLFF